MFTIKATTNDSQRTLFKVIIAYCNNVPLSRIEKAFRNKDIKLNGKRVKEKNLKVSLGDEIIIYGLENTSNFLKYQKTHITFNPIYEDENILVISKPINVVMHSEIDSLDAQVWRYLKFKQKDSFVPSSIGRLDKVTSGLIIYAKNYQTLMTLKQNQNLLKTYIFKANISFDEAQEISYYHRYNDNLNKAELFTKKVSRSKKATTLFFSEKDNNFARLITGKKHQIRVTLAKLNAPILGDRRYGGKPAKRVFLHSYKISFYNLENHLKYLNGEEIIAPVSW